MGHPVNVRHEYHGTAPIPLKAGHTYAVTLADVTTLGTGDGESDVVIFHWDVSSVTETPSGDPPQLHQPKALAALRSLWDVGPGAICDSCGHFASRHIPLSCEWPERKCACKGFSWQGFIFAMDGPRGPMYVREKA